MNDTVVFAGAVRLDNAAGGCYYQGQVKQCVFTVIRWRKGSLLASRTITSEHRRGHREAGFLSVAGILTLLFVGAVIFAAFKLLPPYIANYQFQDSLNNIARTATYSRASETEIRDQILAEARNAGVALDASQVTVARSGANLNVGAEYVVTVDLLVRQVNLEFAPSAGNRIITAR